MSVHSRVAAAEADDRPTCSLWYIRRELGRHDYSDRRMVGYVTALIRELGFPPPLPSMVKKELTTSVTQHSHWLRSSVDAWLNDFLPPANAASVDRAAQAAAATEMDAAAHGLRLVRGGRP